MKKLLLSFVLLFLNFSILFSQEDYAFLDLKEYGGKLVPTTLLNKISIHLDDAPFELALSKIAEKSRIQLNYSRNQIPLNRKVSLHKNNVYAMEALLTVLKNTGTILKITNAGFLAVVSDNESKVQKSKSFKGTIKGTIKDSQSGEPLPGANVFIKGTNIGASSDFEGKYVIPNVPPGSFTLVVKYIGYKDTEIPIKVQAGKSETINVELDFMALKGDEVTITAQAEGQMAAINQQISARTIKNVVSADRIQEIPDVNAAESVARLPGISIIRSGGEGQKVAIRGMSPKYNVMQVNGVRMQSTDPNDRSVDLNMISPNILSGIEVTKAVTADMDADAVGGTVNLKINKAKEGFHSNFSSQGGYGSVGDVYNNYRVTGLLSHRFFDNKLGVQISGTIDRFDRSSDGLSAGYTINEEATKVQDMSVIDLSSVSISDSKTTRKRKGGGLVLDYQLPHGTLLFNNFISHLTGESISMSNGFGVQGSSFSSNTSVSDGGGNTVYSNALQGEFEFFNMKMDFTVSNSVSKQDVPGSLRMTVVPETQQAGFRSSLIEKAVEATPSEFVNSVEMFDILRVNDLRSTMRDVVVAERNAKIDFTLPYRVSNFLTGELKFGGKYRYNKRENDESENYVHPDRETSGQHFTEMLMDSLWTDLGLQLEDTGNGINAHLFEDPNYDIGNFLSGEEGIDKLYYYGSIDKMKHYEELAIQYDSFFISSQETYQSDYTYEGDISAFYLMTEMNLGKHITFMPGIRYENNKTDYFAYGTRRFGENWWEFSNEELTSQREKDNWFPQMHLRLKPVDWFDIRLASTRTIIYPDYKAFSPYYFYNTSFGGHRISLGNTELKPALAQNYDIYASLYENYVGLLTFGYFYKEIDDLIAAFGYQTKDSGKINNRIELSQNVFTGISTWINLPHTTFVRGFEADWQTNFWYLPSLFRGLVFNINFTHMRSETAYPFQTVVKDGTGLWARTTLVDTSRTGRMPHQPNDILNSTLGYDFRDFSARLSFVYQGNVLAGIAGRKELDSFTDDYYRWDLIVNQKLPWQGLELYFNVNNITNRPDRSYTSVLELLHGVNYYGRTADFGIRYKF